DAGGGSGPWAVRVQTQAAARGTTVSAPATVSVPGSLSLRATAASNARQGDTTGFVVLSRGAVPRRLPCWLRVTAPQLRRDAHRTLTRPGIYHGNTKGRAALVACYRYPTDPSPLGVAPRLRGPGQW